MSGNLYAKFDYGRLRNEKVLVLLKSDNNKEPPTTTTTRTTFVAFGDLSAVADPGFAKGGWGDHGERAEREPKRGSGGGAPSGVQGQSPWWGPP